MVESRDTSFQNSKGQSARGESQFSGDWNCIRKVSFTGDAGAYIISGTVFSILVDYQLVQSGTGLCRLLLSNHCVNAMFFLQIARQIAISVCIF